MKMSEIEGRLRATRDEIDLALKRCRKKSEFEERLRALRDRVELALKRCVKKSEIEERLRASHELAELALKRLKALSPERGTPADDSVVDGGCTFRTCSEAQGRVETHARGQVIDLAAERLRRSKPLQGSP
jgi:hypothetical protein